MIRRRKRVNRRYTIALGPRIDLHAGIHGSLCEEPPTDYRYVIRDATHWFFGKLRGGFSPVQHRHFGECISIDSRAVIHSSRWPVLDSPRWIVELDDLGYPLLFGRHGLLASFRRAFGRPWTVAFASDLRHRASLMLRAYAHPSCQRVVFRTQAALDAATDLAGMIRLEDAFAPVVRKATVIRPAVKATLQGTMARKWEQMRPLRVLFCGRDFVAKDGVIALRAVRALLVAGYDLRLTYIGDVPGAVRHSFATLANKVSFTGCLDRSAVLKHMDQAHVLLHTSPAESVGMVLLEAAAAGMAVIASRSPGMRHLTELLPTRGFVAVDRTSGSRKEHARCFQRALAVLVASPERARDMGYANHHRATVGPSSIAVRNNAWQAIYDEARHTRSRLVLSHRYLADPPLSALAKMSSPHLSRLIERHLARVGSTERTFRL